MRELLMMIDDYSEHEVVMFYATKSIILSSEYYGWYGDTSYMLFFYRDFVELIRFMRTNNICIGAIEVFVDDVYMLLDFCYQDDNENTAHYDALLDTFLDIYAGQYSYRFAVTPLSQRLVSAIKQHMYESAPSSIKYAVDMGIR